MHTDIKVPNLVWSNNFLDVHTTSFIKREKVCNRKRERERVPICGARFLLFLQQLVYTVKQTNLLIGLSLLLGTMIVILTLYILSPWILSCLCRLMQKELLIIEIDMQCFLFLRFFTGLLQAFMLGHTLLRGIVISHHTFYYLVAQYLFAGTSELSVPLLLLISVPLLQDALNPFVSISLRGIRTHGLLSWIYFVSVILL